MLGIYGYIYYVTSYSTSKLLQNNKIWTVDGPIIHTFWIAYSKFNNYIIWLFFPTGTPVMPLYIDNM